MKRNAFACAVLFSLGLLLPADSGFSQAPESGSSGPGSFSAGQDPIWQDFLKRKPYPHLIPLPEPRESPVDGLYVKRVHSPAARIHCLRCPDYAPEGGLWKLHLSRGVFRIFHPESKWKSIGTFWVSGNRFLVTNDPVCIHDIGLYGWALTGGKLNFKVIDDPCAISLRAKNLTQLLWSACPFFLPDTAVNGRGFGPEGCR